MRQPDKQQEQQDCADWHIDEKGIVPAQVLGQPAADQWPHHGAKNHSHAEQGHSDWLLVRRQSFSHNSHCGRNEHAAREALTRAADDHCRKVGCNPAQHRKGGERADRDDEEGSQTEQPFQPSAQRNDDDFSNEK